MRKNNLIKKGVVFSVILLFFSVSVIPSTGTNVVEQSSMPSSSGTTFYVDDDFNEETPGWNVTHFDNIQNAINVTFGGDTVYVYSGIYYENIEIEKNNITLLGEDRETTIVNCSGATASRIEIYKRVKYVTVSGFTVKNCNPKITNINIIDVHGDYNEISNNIVVGPNNDKVVNGIHIHGQHNLISNNIISKCDIGIHCRGDDDLIPTYNTISGNTLTEHYNFGIYLDFTMFDRIINNNIYETEDSKDPPDEWPFVSYAGFGTWISIFNIWTRNYWGEPRFFLVPILGWQSFVYGYTHLVSYDIFPRKFPY